MSALREDTNANVVPLWGYVRPRSRRTPREIKEPVKESNARALIDDAFSVAEGATQRYSTLKKRRNLPRTDDYNPYTNDYNRWLANRRDSPTRDLVGLQAGDFNISGAQTLLMASEQGNTWVGAGKDTSAALDALTNRPKKGLLMVDRALDLGGVLFVGDSKYDLKQIISRSKATVGKLGSPVVAQLKQTFNIPDDLQLQVGWKAGLDDAFEVEDLGTLLNQNAKKPARRPTA